MAAASGNRSHRLLFAFAGSARCGGQRCSFRHCSHGVEKKPAAWRQMLSSRIPAERAAPRDRKTFSLNRQLADAKSAEEVFCLWRSFGEDFDTVHMAAALRASVAAEPEDPRRHSLLAAARQQVHNFRAQDLAVVAWALAKADAVRDGPGRELMQAVAAAVEARASEFRAYDIAVTAWAMAKADEQAWGVVDALAVEAQGRLDEFGATDAVNLSWALARQRVHNEKLSGRLACLTAASFSELNSQDVSNAAWAFAKLEVHHEDLMESIAAAGLSHPECFQAQELTSLCWAFAWLDLRHEALFSALGKQSVQCIEHFNAQGLARLAWAFAKVELWDRALFTAIASHAEERMASFSGSNLAKLAWAFAKVELDCSFEPLMNLIAMRAHQILEDFNARDLGMLAWALAKAEVAAEPLLQAIAGTAVPLVPEFTAQGLANTAAAFAASSVCHHALMHAIAVSASEKMSDFSAQGLADLQWAFAALDLEVEALESAIFNAPGWEGRPPYEHHLHAGGMADCFKHVLLVMLLQRLTDTSRPVQYIDTHAGGGVYDLASLERGQVRRSEEGVQALAARAASAAETIAEPIVAYLEVVQACNEAFQVSANGASAKNRADSEEGGKHDLRWYPGSPAIALSLLRQEPGDTATLFETSTPVYQQLCRSLAAYPAKKVAAWKKDAYKFDQNLALALDEASADSGGDRQTLVLVDPPYELSFTDTLNIGLLKQLQKHAPASCVALWYPIRNLARTSRVYHRVQALQLGPALACELEVSREAGSTMRTGMLLLRPPGCLEQELRQVMPELARLLASDPEVKTGSRVFWL